jgi:Na+-driven multidrug efflux pump
MKTQTDNAVIYAYGVQYFKICLIFSGGLFLELIFEKMLQATGRTMLSMIVQGTGAILNIVFDPIFIFEKGEVLFNGAFVMPFGFGLDVAGAACATVLGQTVGGILGFILCVKYNKELNLKFKNFAPRAKYIKDILFIGVPSIIMASIGSVMTLCMNKILSGLSYVHVNVFGAYFKLQSYVFMPVFGLNNGMVPIVAYN